LSYLSKAEDADAILTGTHSAEVHGDKVIRLSPKQQSYSRLAAQTTAENCADALRKDWEKAAK
jgi:hypothetical protein